MVGKAKINADLRKSRNQKREMTMRQNRFNKYRREYEEQLHTIHDIAYDIAVYKRECDTIAATTTYTHKQVEREVLNKQRRELEHLQLEKYYATQYAEHLLKKMRANEV